LLGELASSESLSFESVEEFPPEKLHAGLRLLVALPPDPGVAELAALAQPTPLLAVDIPGLPAAENLTVIGAQGGRPDQLGFIAGYLAAVVNGESRIGAVVPAGTPEGKAARLGFLNGATFYCGLCRPNYPPFIQYPIVVELDEGAGEAGAQQAAQTMLENAVEVAFVYPFAGNEAVLKALAEVGINLIGGASPNPAWQPRWVASIRPNLTAALRLLLPALLKGEAAAGPVTPWAIRDANPDNLSPGRQSLVEAMLAELEAGFIGTGVDPQTGEPVP
jgi:hypothetical protein